MLPLLSKAADRTELRRLVSLFVTDTQPWRRRGRRANPRKILRWACGKVALSRRGVERAFDFPVHDQQAGGNSSFFEDSSIHDEAQLLPSACRWSCNFENW